MAKLIGDGVFAVFGGPTVHEDDAERAVRSSLRLLEDTLDRILETGSLQLVTVSGEAG